MAKVSLEQKDHIAYVTINSPPANALSTDLLKDLTFCLDQIESDLSLKAVVLKGEGKFFSAGADIKEFTSISEAEEFQRLAKNGQELFQRIEQFSIPIIAAIHGAALGGGLELAMACHMRVVSYKAKLGLPELTLGIIPGFAGTQRLPQLIGGAKAYEMILTGKPIEGSYAEQIGLVNIATSETEVFKKAERLAKLITNKSKPTITAVMKLISYAKLGRYDEGANGEVHAFGEIFTNQDAQEGIQAFLEKRQPNFKDR